MSSTNNFDNRYADNAPDRKFDRLGPSALTEVELLALILRNGTKSCDVLSMAERILHLRNYSLADLINVSIEELCGIPGIGPVKARELKSVFELSRRITRACRRQRIQLNDARSIAGYYMEGLRHEENELLVAAYFNIKGELIYECTLSQGGSDSTQFPLRKIFEEALLHRASQFVLLHNHPSGDPRPSQADYESTQKALRAGQYLEISLRDHIIIGDNQYYSFREGDLI